MFKLAHLSDLHIGYKSTRKINSQGINVREADGYLALSRMIDDIIEEGVDAVIVAGDTFHTPTPDTRSVIFVQNCLIRLWKARIPAYILAGNHDENDIPSDIAGSKILHDPWRNIYSYAEPYKIQKIGPGINLHMISHHNFDEQVATMNKIHTVDDEINILTTHGSVYDEFLHKTLRTEKAPREIVIPDNLIKDNKWDYIMLGHIHERGWVNTKDRSKNTENSNIYYNGSLIRRGFSDKETPLGRGWTLWEIDENGKFTSTAKTIEQRPQYDLGIIDADKITTTEITEKVIENLQKTQLNGTKYDISTAPILRQKIINLTPAKNSGISWNAINEEAQHALAWKINKETKQQTQKKLEKQITEPKDVITNYDTWIKQSETLKNSEEKTKEQIIKEAREYIKLGQKIVLTNE